MTSAAACLRLLAAALVVMGVFGCKAKPADEDESSQRHHHESDDEHKKTGAAQPGLVTIDPEMVRDLRVKTAVVEARPSGEGVSILGELHVNEDAYAQVGTPIEARVTRLLAAAGDVVPERAPLAELESVELGRARASESTARARAELARQAVARKRQLANERIVASREVQESEAEAKVAEAELSASRSGLKALGIAADAAGGARFILRSPVSGTVLERNLSRGQVVAPDQTLFRVADLKTLWLIIHAFERDALRVKVGATARIAFPALPGRSFSGKVIWVGSQVDVASRTIPVRVSVASDNILRPGMSATAFIGVGDAGGTAITVPAASLQRLEGTWVVFIPTKRHNVFEIRKVGRGPDLGGEVEILSHLAAGETVVVDGSFLIKAEAEKARGMGEQHEH